MYFNFIQKVIHDSLKQSEAPTKYKYYLKM